MNSGYDISTDTYSPEGRVFQVEYATKAVDNQGTVIGIRCVDGVVLAAEKLLPSRNLDKRALQRVFQVDKQCGVCIGGSQPDGLFAMRQAREECSTYRSLNGNPIMGKTIAARIGEFLHMFTLYGAYRPLGCSLLVASYADDGPKLHMVDPSGTSTEYIGCAAGKAKTEAKSELEKLEFSKITCKEAVEKVQHILHTLHDDTKDTYFQFEFGWVTDETDRTFGFVPDELIIPYVPQTNQESSTGPSQLAMDMD